MCTSVADAFLVQSYYKLRGSFVKQSGPKTEQRLVRHHTTAFIMEYEGLLFLVIVLVVLAVAWVVKQQIFLGVDSGQTTPLGMSSLIENLGQARCATQRRVLLNHLIDAAGIRIT